MNPYDSMQLAVDVNKHIHDIQLRTLEIKAGLTDRVKKMDRLALISRLENIEKSALEAGKLMNALLPAEGRFVVHEHFNGFRIEDTKTGQDHWLSDGVDCVPHPDNFDEYLPPGGPLFCALWADSFNSNESDTLEAYFPDEYAKS